MLFLYNTQKTDNDEEISKNCEDTISLTIKLKYVVDYTADKKDKEANVKGDGFLRRQSF